MIELHAFGAPDLRHTSGEGTGAVRLQPKRLALLAYLALAATESFCRRDTLLALFWPTLDAEHARNALSQAVHGLRRALGTDLLLSRGVEEIGLAAEHFRCDAVAFEQALRAGRYADALDRYRGALLEGFHLSDAPDFMRWLDRERERFRQHACQAAAALADREEKRRNAVGAAHWLRRLLDLAPDDEAALQRLLRVLDRSGDRAGALRVYTAFARRLMDALELEPSPETQALIERIRSRTTSSTPQPGPSIAVLPFDNLSADPEQAYFCEGITEEIINALAGIPGLRVAARTSVFAFKDRTADLKAIGEALNVTTLLEGSVRKAGTRLRITAQLINASDGFHLWSERYDREVGDVFVIQDKVARAIAEQLKGTLQDATTTPLVHPSTNNLDAYDLYLKGRFHWYRKNPVDLQKAAACFRDAVDQDPHFAQGYLGLAMAHTSLGGAFYDVLPPHDTYLRAKEAVMKALALNERLAEAHACLGAIRLFYDWDWAGADQALRQALMLAPDQALPYHGRAILLLHLGCMEEALLAEQRAAQLEPFVLAYKEMQGLIYCLGRRYHHALDHLRQTVEMEPRLYLANVWIGLANAALERYEEAHAAYQYTIQMVGRRPYVLGLLGALYATWSRDAEAHTILEELDRLAGEHYVRPTYPARIHVALGDHDRALTLLEAAYAQRDDHLPITRYDFSFDAIRSDPRFLSLMKKMGLTEEALQPVIARTT